MTMQPTDTAYHLTNEADQLREESDEIERLLSEARSKAGPGTWPIIEQALQRVVSLYAAGLERLLAYSTESGATASVMHEHLTRDELVSSLLVLHGLHPLSIADRVTRALDRVRPYLGSHAGDVEFVDVSDGVVRLRLLGTCHGCASSQVTVNQLLRRVIEEVAPEVTDVVVDGVPKNSGTLIQLNVKQNAPESGPLWTKVDDLASLAGGQSRLLTVGTTRVFVLRQGESLLAYRDGCPACDESLERATVEEGILHCAGCGHRYDLLRAGRPVDAQRGSLQPIPLLSDDSGVRLALGGGSP